MNMQSPENMDRLALVKRTVSNNEPFDEAGVLAARGGALKARNCDHLRQIMTRLVWTQKDLAISFGIKPKTIGQWLKNNDAPFWTLKACRGIAGDCEIKNLKRQLRCADEQNDDALQTQIRNLESELTDAKRGLVAPRCAVVVFSVAQCDLSAATKLIKRAFDEGVQVYK